MTHLLRRHFLRIVLVVSVLLLVLALGIQPQVFAAPLAATAGPNYAGTATQGVAVWGNPGNSTGAPDSTCSNSANPGAAIDLTNFSFSIPAGSSITGILVEPKAAIAPAPDSPIRSYETPKPKSPQADDTAQLLKAGSPAGTAKATWAPVAASCSGTAFASLGGAGDTWGTTWTVSDINNANFGVRLTDSAAKGLFIDAVRITVLYDPPTVPTPVRPSEVPEADTLLLFGGGLGGLATWVGWQLRKARAKYDPVKAI